MLARGVDPVEEKKAAKARLILAQRKGLLFKDAVANMPAGAMLIDPHPAGEGLAEQAQAGIGDSW